MRMIAVLATGFVAVPMLSQPAVANGELSFTLKNQSTRDIHYLYAAPAGQGPGNEDVLGDDYLASGYSITLSVPDAAGECLFDLRFVLDDGSERSAQAVDLCVAGFTLYE